MKLKEFAVLSIAGVIAAGCLATATASAIMQRHAIESRAHATETVVGTIEAVTLDRNEFTLEVKSDQQLMGAKQLTIKVHDKTLYTLDGQDSTRDMALKKDREATVTHEEQLASRVDVRTAGKPS